MLQVVAADSRGDKTSIHRFLSYVSKYSTNLAFPRDPSYIDRYASHVYFVHGSICLRRGILASNRDFNIQAGRACLVRVVFPGRRRRRQPEY